MSDGSPLAILRLWAQATADLIDVSERFWNGVMNLNPVELDTDTAAGEGSTTIRSLATASRLHTAPFIDDDGAPMPAPEVVLNPSEVGANAGLVEVKVRVTAAGRSHGRYTSSILDDTGAQVSDRFSVYMAQCGPPP